MGGEWRIGDRGSNGERQRQQANHTDKQTIPTSQPPRQTDKQAAPTNRQASRTWQGDDHPVALDGRRQSQSNPRVARSRFNQRISWLDPTRLLRVLDHPFPNAIFDRSTSVEKLTFGQELTFQSTRHFVDLHEWCVPNVLQDGCHDLGLVLQWYRRMGIHYPILGSIQ